MSKQTASLNEANAENRLLTATLSVALALMMVFVLIVGKSLLVPFAIAILLWFIINALSGFLKKHLSIGEFRIPGWGTLTASLVVVLAVCLSIAEIVATNIQAMAEKAPQYLDNIDALTMKLAQLFGSEAMAQFLSAIDNIDLEAVLLNLANGAAGLISNAGAVVLYVAFLLAEQQYLGKKLKAMSGNQAKGAKISTVLDDIGKRIRTYLFTKSLTSATMAAFVWVVLIIAGVDFAGFWAFLVFILNFIPVIGGFVSGVFPAILALIQFPTFAPFVIVVVGVAMAHLIIGNIVEPRFVGSSVNLSPLVVILALAVWGFIWGVPGMFLCVPLTVIGMIIFTQFNSTRPIAIALSENGEIK